jgi:SAM-dependent methyltransferase
LEIVRVKECPVCGSDRGAPATDLAVELELPAPLAVRTCNACGHGFMSPAPSEAWLRAFYDRAEGYAADTFVARYAAIGAQNEALLDEIERRACPGRAGRLLLDFGCGDGRFLETASRRGWRATGYEPAHALANAARARGLEVIGDLDRAPARLDAVHSSHVLEHLHDPKKALQWIASHLAEGGLLSLQLPNQFADVLWPFLHTRWIARGKPLGYHLHHLQFFTARSLERLLGDTGFQILHLSTSFALRNRRTAASGPRRAVRAAKTALYIAAAPFGRGPHLEAFARKQG